MAEEKKVVEIEDTEVEKVAGGYQYCGCMITTGISPKCGRFEPGANFYNRKIMALSNTCGACKHLTYSDGWNVCAVRTGDSANN